MTRQIIYAVIMAVIWCLFHENFAIPTFLSGLLISVGILFFLRRAFYDKLFTNRIFAVIRFGVIFLIELIKANLTVIRIVYLKNLKSKLKPGFLELPLTVQSDFGITLLADAITLTPGTLSVDISPDKKFLYVHFLHVEDSGQAKADIKNILEKPILDILGKSR